MLSNLPQHLPTKLGVKAQQQWWRGMMNLPQYLPMNVGNNDVEMVMEKAKQSPTAPPNEVGCKGLGTV
eukprot:13082022-Ditylum_brightwellii.AAC.1